VIKTTVEAERQLALDVYGNLESEAVVSAKVIAVAKEKQQHMPVIIIFPTIEQCNQLKPQFQHCFVFGVGRVPA
jgi:hypothetical protein